MPIEMKSSVMIKEYADPFADFGRYRCLSILLIALLACLGTIFPCQTAQTHALTLEPDHNFYALSPYLEILPDPHRQWSIADVTTAPLAQHFVAHDKGSLNLGLSASAYWIRFHLVEQTRNGTSNTTPIHWLLDLNNAAIESAKLYWICPDDARPHLLAERDLWKPLAVKATVYENMLFPLPSELSTPGTFVLRIVSVSSSLYLPMTVVTSDVYRAKQARTLLWYGFYFGIIVVMFVTNLIFYLTLREHSRLYYLCFVVFTAVYFASRDSLTVEYLFRARPFLDFYLGHISLGLLILFTLLFSKDFLNTRHLSRTLDHALTLLILLSVVNMVLIPFRDPLLTQYLSTLLGLIVSLALLLTGLASLRSGFRPARFYLMSFVFFLSGAILYALNYAGVLSYGFTTLQSFQIGSALQVILLSIALSDKITELERQRESARAETVQALEKADTLNIELQEYGRTLERKVEERTEHLHQALIKVEEMANTDALTGLFNRRKFNEILTAALERSQRYERSLSVIIFDIDHFKRINDTYGHQIGDEVLQELSRIVSGNIRKTDALARWGGEEFVIIAFEITLEQAVNLAEKIRQVVDSHCFPAVGHVTISLGFTSYATDDSVDTIMARVDNALYRAKTGGRNRVEMDAPPPA